MAELTILQIGKHRLHTLHSELKAHNLSTQTGVEASIVVLGLGLAENSLHNNCLLDVIGQKFLGLVIKARLALTFTITKHENTEFTTLFFVIVGRDLIEPESHILVVVFRLLSISLVLLSLVADFFSEGIFWLEPVASASTHLVVGFFIIPTTLIFITLHVTLRAIFSALGAFIRFKIFEAFGRAIFPHGSVVEQGLNLLNFLLHCH